MQMLRAKPLGDYLREMRSLINHDEKFFACLNTILFEYEFMLDNPKDKIEFANNIRENG